MASSAALATTYVLQEPCTAAVEEILTIELPPRAYMMGRA